MKKTRVLVVDDNIELAETILFILEDLGCSVLTAFDGIKAIEVAKNEHFDIAFIDIKMPGINGVETYKRLKCINQKAIFVMMTGYADDDLISYAKEEGVYDVIYKPLDIKKIIAIVKGADKKIIMIFL